MAQQNLLLFKQDMLQWASQILEVPIQSINQFRDGVYFIQLLRNLNHKYQKNSYFEDPSDQSKVYHNLTLVDQILKQVSKYTHFPTTYPNCDEEILYFDLDIIRYLNNQSMLNDFDKIRVKLKKCYKLLDKNCHPMSKLSSLYQLFDINKLKHLAQDMDCLKNSQDLFTQFEESKQEFKPQNLSSTNLGKIVQVEEVEQDKQVEIPNLFNSPPVINTNLFQQQNNKYQTSQILQSHPKNQNQNFHLQNLSTYLNRQHNTSQRINYQTPVVSQQEEKNKLNTQQQQEDTQQITDQFTQGQKEVQIQAMKTGALNEQISEVRNSNCVDQKNVQQNIFGIPPSQDLLKNENLKLSNNSPIQQNQDQNQSVQIDTNKKVI